MRGIDDDEVIKAALLGCRSRSRVVSWIAPVRLDDDDRKPIPELPIALASDLHEEQPYQVAYLLPGVFRLSVEHQEAILRALPNLLRLHYAGPQYLEQRAG